MSLVDVLALKSVPSLYIQQNPIFKTSSVEEFSDSQGQFFLPGCNWEQDNYITKTSLPISFGENIYLFKISDIDTNHFREFLSANAVQFEVFADKRGIRGCDIADFNKRADKLLSCLEDGIVISNIDAMLFVIHPCYRQSSTVETKNGHRVGLHVDNFHPTTLDKRKYSPGRLCINLGEGNRYFWFVDKTLGDIVLTKDYELSITHPTTAAKNYFRNNEHVIVKRVCIPPSYGYIAPTENIIHDATAYGSGLEDMFFFMRGVFHQSTGAG